MNRLSAFILTALLALSALTGCTSTNTPPADSTPSTGSNAPADSSSTSADSTTNTLAPTSADDFPDTPISEFKYKYDAELKGVVITAYTGNSSLKVRIPDTIENEPVVGIERAFYEKGVMEVFIPDTVTHIGERAFEFCEITRVTIPESVTYIGDWAFSSCKGLTRVSIPSGVIEIADNAFCECKSLVEISVDADNPNYSSIDGVLFNKDKTTLFIYPMSKSLVYTVPESVTDIKSCAFDAYNIPSGFTVTYKGVTYTSVIGEDNNYHMPQEFSLVIN